MKKIMFNDKYGLTRAVLEGRKTQTRRIVDVSKLSKMQIDSLDDENSDLGILTMGNLLDDSRYKVGEEVAVAQSYKDCAKQCIKETGLNVKTKEELLNSKGYTNKMFVKAEYMPYRIWITNVRLERLQDISEEDCLKEGVEQCETSTCHKHYCIRDCQDCAPSPREAFASLIDKISGKGTWDSNPYVFVYDFELIK